MRYGSVDAVCLYISTSTDTDTAIIQPLDFWVVATERAEWTENFKDLASLLRPLQNTDLKQPFPTKLV